MARIYYDLRGILPFPTSSELRMAGMVRTIVEWGRHLAHRSDVAFVAPGLERVVKAALLRNPEYRLIGDLVDEPAVPSLTEKIALRLPPPFIRTSLLSRLRRRLAVGLEPVRFATDTKTFFNSTRFPGRFVYLLPSVKLLPPEIPTRCVPVMNVYDLIPLVFKEGKFIGDRRYMESIQRIQTLGGHFVVNSNYVKHSLVCMFDILPDRVHVVNLGAFKAEEAPEAIALRSVKPYFLHIAGNCQRRKNVDGTMRGFIRFLEKTGADYDLRYVGPSQSDLEPLISRYGKQFRHQILGEGHVSDAKLDSLIRGAACGLYLSLSEGFGLPPLEFMTRSIPVISTNLTSVPEAVGDAGPLVDPFNQEEIASAMQMITTDHSAATKYIAKGKERAALLSWRNSGATLESTLEGILAGYAR